MADAERCQRLPNDTLAKLQTAPHANATRRGSCRAYECIHRSDLQLP
jgi:hypothetical protein